MKKAFTLIELLVVIAIIAILAAILFPVFAQAKAAAKATANLSNLKQVGTSLLIYSNDSDDVFPLAVRYNDVTTMIDGTTVSYAPWQESAFPYTKSREIYVSPLDNTAAGTGAAKQIQQWQYYGVVPRQAAIGNGTQAVAALPVNTSAIIDGPFGYSNGTGSVPSLSQTAIEHISDAVMISDAGSFDMGYLGGSGSLPANNAAATPKTAGTFTGVAPFAGTVMTGPWARKNVSGDWKGGKSATATVNTSKGQSQYAATDSSAKSVDVSKMYEIRSNGTNNVYYRLYVNSTQ